MYRTKQEEDKFHRREWAMQRVGWVLIGAVIVLAVAGMFGGGGPLSHAQVASREAGTIEYERYTRHEATTTLTIIPAAAALQANIVRVTIPSAYLQAFRVEEITPEPTHVRTSGEQLVYEFNVTGAGSSISFLMQPRDVGSHSTQISIGSAAPLTLSQFTYP